MLLDQVCALYQALDYKMIYGNGGSVRLFHRIEGADHAHELLWILDEKPERNDYDAFSENLQSIVQKPGSKRMRVISEDESYFSSLGDDFRLSRDVDRHTWLSLVNDLFHSDRFCDKVEIDYGHYSNILSQQLRGVTGNGGVKYRYIEQQLKFRDGKILGKVTEEFLNYILTANNSNPMLVMIQAPAGYGKTAFSYHFAQIIAKGHRESPKKPFPVFIPFTKYRRFGGVRDILRAEIEELKLYGVNSRALLQLIHEGHAIVVLDGFDELMAEVGKRSAKANLSAIAEFMSGNARVILTSRSAFLSTSIEIAEMMENKIGLDAINVMELVPIAESDDEIRNYLNMLSISDERIENTITSIKSSEAVRSLCKSPLMLNTFASYSAKEMESPPTKETLYERHAELLCNRERIRQDHNLSNKLQMKFLSKMAEYMYSDGTFFYDSDTLGLFWEAEPVPMLLNAGIAPEDLEAYRAKLLCHALFDSAVSGDPIEEERGIEFVHPSFRDFFIFREISRTIAITDDEDFGKHPLLSRLISGDLAEFFTSKKEDNITYIEFFLRDNEVGLKNALILLVTAIENFIITAEEGETLLNTAIQEKRFSKDISGMRVTDLVFNNWDFGESNFNECRFINCMFDSCDFTRTLLFSSMFNNCILKDSKFGKAEGINGLAVVVDGEIERLFNSQEIRSWLHEQGAEVYISDIRILQPEPEEDLSLGRELFEHIALKFFPRGSDSEQRFRKLSTFATGIPPELKKNCNDVLGWLRRKNVIIRGKSVGGNETLGLSGEWRDDIRAYIKNDQVSEKISSLLLEADEII